MSISSHLYISVTSSVLAGFSFLLLQRSIDIWSYVLPLRVRVLFDNAKWLILMDPQKKSRYPFKIQINN